MTKNGENFVNTTPMSFPGLDHSKFRDYRRENAACVKSIKPTDEENGDLPELLSLQEKESCKPAQHSSFKSNQQKKKNTKTPLVSLVHTNSSRRGK